jgi:hypothetical protein
MTLPRLAELGAYWKDVPPMHILVAAYFGALKKKPDKPPARKKRNV